MESAVSKNRTKKRAATQGNAASSRVVSSPQSHQSTVAVSAEDLEQLRLRWAEVERQKSLFAMLRESYEFFRSQVIVRNGLHPGVSINLKTGEVANG